MFMMIHCHGRPLARVRLLDGATTSSRCIAVTAEVMDRDMVVALEAVMDMGIAMVIAHRCRLHAMAPLATTLGTFDLAGLVAH